MAKTEINVFIEKEYPDNTCLGILLQILTVNTKVST